MLKNILNVEGIVVLNNNDKKKINGGSEGDDYLDCEKTQIDLNDDLDSFTVHETCCSKPELGGGGCFEVTYIVA